MIDFRTLVESILITLEEETPAPVATATSNETPKELEDFIAKQYPDIKALWSTQFSGFPIPTLEEVKQAANTAAQSGLRSTMDPERYNNFKTIFPLLDLSYGLYDKVYKGKTPQDPTKAKDFFTKQNADAMVWYNEWKKRIVDQKINIPIQYNSKNTWPTTVLTKFFQKAQDKGLGINRLESLPQNLTIYAAVLQLTNLVKTRYQNIGFIPDNIAQVIRPNQYIDEYLVNWRGVIGGTSRITDKRLDQAFDNIRQPLKQVCAQAFEFFRSETESFHGPQDLSNPKSVINNKDAWLQFIGKGYSPQAKPLDWLKYGAQKKQEADTEEDNSPDEVADSAPSPTPAPTPAPAPAPAPTSAPPLPAPTPTTSPSEVPGGVPTPEKPDRETYNLALIKSLADAGNEKAKLLHNALQQLGDQTVGKKAFNFAATVNKIADVGSALSLGLA